MWLTAKHCGTSVKNGDVLHAMRQYQENNIPLDSFTARLEHHHSSAHGIATQWWAKPLLFVFRRLNRCITPIITCGLRSGKRREHIPFTEEDHQIVLELFEGSNLNMFVDETDDSTTDFLYDPKYMDGDDDDSDGDDPSTTKNIEQEIERRWKEDGSESCINNAGLETTKNMTDLRDNVEQVRMEVKQLENRLMAQMEKISTILEAAATSNS